MVRTGTTKRQRFRPYRKDPVLQQNETVHQNRRDEHQVVLARGKVEAHPEFVARTTGAFLASRIFDAFPSARKDGPKSKTQVAIEIALRQLRIDYPARYADKVGIRIGQRIARDCLRDAGTDIYGSGSHTPPSAQPG